MTLATWLPSVLRAEGLHVITLEGWPNRQTHAGFSPQGLVCHHTATPRSASDLAVRALLRDGRAGLSGPLAQLGLERDGTFVVIAAGRCNHNGYGEWGNDSIGIEAYNDGKGEPWPTVQMDAYARGAAAICRQMGWSPDRVKGHKETDPDRKIDPLFDMGAFRSSVAEALKPSPQPLEEHDEMTFVNVVDSGKHYMVRGVNEDGSLDARPLGSAEIWDLVSQGWAPRKMKLATWRTIARAN